MHPDGVNHDDGNHIAPSKAQSWLWGKHQAFIADIAAIRAGEPDAVLHYWNTGDLVDGDHHNTSQIVGRDEGLHIEAAADVLTKGVLTLEPDYIHILRGTPSHVGQGGSLEGAVAREVEARGCPVVRDIDTGSHTWRWLRAEIGGISFDVRHHGRTGMREHTRKSYAALYAWDIWATFQTSGDEPPDIAVRSHKHTYMDSGPDQRGVTRAIACPAWQLSSEWVHSKAIESLADIGGVVFVVRNGDVAIRPLLYKPDRPTVWSPT